MKKITLIITVIILLILAIDTIKINQKFINKPFIEFSITNVKSSFLKGIINKINDFFLYFYPENFHQKQTKYYDPFKFDENSLILHSNKDKIISYSNGLNSLNYSEWKRSHGNEQSNRFSYLEEINYKNAHNIKKIWEFSFDGEIFSDIQCNPIIENGFIYTPTSNGSILSIKATTGELVWKNSNFSRYVAKRGILIDKQNNSNFLFFSDNKHLISLNANDGNYNLNFGKKGKVKLNGSSVVAPVIYQNLIITVTNNKTIEAFNKTNGKKFWAYSFEDPNNHKKIFGKKYFNYGGNPWGGISLDGNRGILYITTGNPSAYFDGSRRPGHNKYSNSVIAFDINKKEIIWDFQETHHDIWNLDIPAPPILTSVWYSKKNKLIDVVVVISKTGNIFLLDRVTGSSLFDIYYKKAPISKIKDEIVSSIQIEKTEFEPFAKNVFSLEEITNRDNNSYQYISKFISNKKFGFFETHELNKENIQFNFHGGAEWMGGSVDHNNGILYLTSNNIAWITSLVKDGNNYSSKFKRLLDIDGYPGNRPPWGKIFAIDLNKGKIIWEEPFGDYPEITFLDSSGKKIKSGTENFGGVTGTAGGVLFATGTVDKKFYILNSKNGKILKEIELPFVGSNPPTVFQSEGKQYVLITSTGSFSLVNGYPGRVNFGNKLILFGLD